MWLLMITLINPLTGASQETQLEFESQALCGRAALTYIATHAPQGNAICVRIR